MVSARDVYVAIFGVVPEQDTALYQSILQGRRDQANYVAKTLGQMGYHKVVLGEKKESPSSRIVPKVPPGIWFRIEGTPYEVYHEGRRGVDLVYDPEAGTVTGPTDIVQSLKVRMVP